MAENLTKFSAGTLEQGVNVFKGNLAPQFYMDFSTVNVTSGINDGVGPRYGFAPIPGHADTESANIGSTKCPGLMYAEIGYGTSSANIRQNVYAIYPIILGGPEPVGAVNANILNVRSTYYVAITGYTNATYSGVTMADVTFISAMPDGSTMAHSTSIYDGVYNISPTDIAKIGNSLATEYVQQSTGNTNRAANLSALTDVTGMNYLASTILSITGPDIPMQWVVGDAATAGDATHPPKGRIGGQSTNFASGLGSVNTGYPSPYAYQKWQSNKPITANIWSLDVNGEWVARYTSTYTPSSSVYIPVFIESIKTTYDATGGTIVLVSSGTYVNTAAVLVNDPSMTVNSSYKAVMVCGKNPFMAIFQDWNRSSSGTLPKYIDLVANPLSKPVLSSYTESGTLTPTAFINLPAFVRGTAYVDATGATGFGPANSGLLRSNTVYEISYSLYDKRLNYETNVFPGAKIQVGNVADFVNFILFLDSHTPAHDLISGVGNIIIPFMGTGTSATQPEFHINYLQYRFYFRQEGMAEWLPTLQIDVPQFWFMQNGNSAQGVCLAAKAVGANIGGRAGGFQDYSTLPSDQYTSCVFFKNRAFWLSDKALYFSRLNQPLCFPAANSVACPSGSFKGAITHTYYGQAEQSGRLIVFSTEGVFVGIFTGNQTQIPVQVAVPTANDSGVYPFPLDGSDFALNPWTSSTAFSSRAAVVAKGVLMWWGPDGVFQDNGVGIPAKVTWNQEPNIFTLYDPARTDEISTVYNDRTKEVYWFYPPKIADGYDTHALVFDTRQNSFLPAKFPCRIDVAMNLAVSSAGVATAGQRIVAFTRLNTAATTQRAYYFDQRNRSGDIYPTGEMMVKVVATPSAGLRRLTLAAGFNGTKFATIAAGDYITLQQCGDYAGAGLATPSDMIAIVSATNAGAGTIDVTLPAEATGFDAAATLTHPQYFPIWHMAKAGAGINGFPWLIQSRYWMPGGVNNNFYWLYIYMTFNLKLLPTTALTLINLAYRTPVSSGLTTDILSMVNNSDNNWQIYHPLQCVNRSNEGQAIQLGLSGTHIGHQWVLQWLEAHATLNTDNFLKEFEG